ncbi:MAG: CoA transferase [Rhodovarius sp.]|nr:CoA transferase [Rhodovarius sp.]MCX7932966.1 CoA transferase [Rhodovarius sp.]MDW8315407.1 CoA transferase [Rhodovarius sp.]
MRPLAGRRILDLSAQAAQSPHGLAAAMAGRLAAAFGAEVYRPDGPRAPKGALGRFLDAGKRIGPAPAAVDAAMGDSGALAGVSAPVILRFSVFGPGQDPPMSEFGLLALSGLLDIVGEAEGSPWPLAGHQPAYAAGLAGLAALLAALRAGGEERIEVSLFDVTCWLNWKVAAAMLVLGRIPRRGGARADWFTLPAADGHIALVYQEKDWPALREMLGLSDPRFDTRAGRLALRREFEAAIRPWFAARTREEITREAQARRIPIGPVRHPAELLSDPQYLARGFLGPGGMPALPFLVDGVRPHG